MTRTAGQVPDLPKEIVERWMKENGYPCGAFKKCNECSPSFYSNCSTWAIWFKKSWSNICYNAEQLKRRDLDI